MLPEPKIIYSPGYDIRFLGLEHLHPFDSCKYSRTWRTLKTSLGRRLELAHICPDSPVTPEELQRVHSQSYLESLRSSAYVARVLELPELGFLPGCILDRAVLKPMRLAVQGTVIAAAAALTTGIAINLSGGYHHASSSRGEGFCAYSDIAIAIAQLRHTGQLAPQDPVLIIDLDAHQGNGLARIFAPDARVKIFDIYNRDIYPQDRQAQKWIDYDLPIPTQTGDRAYLELLTHHLPQFLNQVESPKLAVYNAGTDIFAGDPLGNLNISEPGVLERDQFVFQTLTAAQIPWVMVLSGGYTRQSHRLVANSVAAVLETWGTEEPGVKPLRLR